MTLVWSGQLPVEGSSADTGRCDQCLPMRLRGAWACGRPLWREFSGYGWINGREGQDQIHGTELRLSAVSALSAPVRDDMASCFDSLRDLPLLKTRFQFLALSQGVYGKPPVPSSTFKVPHSGWYRSSRHQGIYTPKMCPYMVHVTADYLMQQWCYQVHSASIKAKISNTDPIQCRNSQ